MTPSAESSTMDSSDAGTTDIITPINSADGDVVEFAPPQPTFAGNGHGGGGGGAVVVNGRTPGSSTTSLSAISNGDAYTTRRHSAAYSIPTSDGMDYRDLSNPFRQSDERPLDTVRRMSRMVEKDVAARKSSYGTYSAKAVGNANPVIFGGQELICGWFKRFALLVSALLLVA
jgi:hypothetical protein